MITGLKKYILLILLVLCGWQPAYAAKYDLEIAPIEVDFSGVPRPALAINGSIPGPTLHFTEGEEVVVNVTNRLDSVASLHWHGFILPYQMDGVPGISYEGIQPGETFTYRFMVAQSGTYWYHSHSDFQEQAGVYGPIIIKPAPAKPVKPESVSADRDYIVMLSDWSDEPPDQVLANLKSRSDYYNNNRRTVFDFFRGVKSDGLRATVADRLAWGNMRMDPTDISDVSGYQFLVNGKTTADNWTGLYERGEKIRLRFINGSAMSYFDIKIPGLKMTVIAADGQAVQPVAVSEFRIAVAETYDVIVEPQDDRAYTIFAAAMDRSGYARGTLATAPGAEAPIPSLDAPPVLASTSHAAMDPVESDHANMGHEQDMAEQAEGRVLRYADLRSPEPWSVVAPTREIELRLTGNMARYFWSINGRKYADAEPIRLRYNERVRVKFVNTTMMNHPMHLHGHWMELDNGAGRFKPRKHVINVKPGETIYFDMTADAMGDWALHCHLLYHMATGMFRKLVVEEAAGAASGGISGDISG